MNPIQAKLKGEPFSAIFEIAAKTFKPITLSYLIYSVASLALVFPILFLVLGIDPQEYLQLLEISDPIQRQRYAEDIFQSVATDFNPLNIVWIVLASVLFLIIASWFYNVCYISIEGYIRGRKMPFADLMKKSLNANVFWLLLASFLISFISVIAFSITGALGAVGGGPGFILVLIGFVLIAALLTRLMLTFPAIVHGNMSVGLALAHSWRNIGFVRALKYLGVGVLAMLVFVILLFVLAMVQAALMAIPVVGLILYLLFSIAFGGFFSAWTTAIFSGIYFRHLPDEEFSSEMAIEDHLII